MSTLKIPRTVVYLDDDAGMRDSVLQLAKCASYNASDAVERESLVLVPDVEQEDWMERARDALGSRTIVHRLYIDLSMRAQRSGVHLADTVSDFRKVLHGVTLQDVMVVTAHADMERNPYDLKVGGYDWFTAWEHIEASLRKIGCRASYGPPRPREIVTMAYPSWNMSSAAEEQGNGLGGRLDRLPPVR